MAFLGATKGMGRALARLMAERGDALFLLGRDLADVEKSARDLEVRGGKGRVGAAPCDLEQPASFAPALDAAEATLGGLDAVVVSAGLFASQEELERDLACAKTFTPLSKGEREAILEKTRPFVRKKIEWYKR